MLLLVLDAGWVSYQLASGTVQLRAASEQLVSRAPDVPFAQTLERIEDLKVQLASLRRLRWHPAYALARMLPGLRSDVEAATAVLDGGWLAASGAETAVRALQGLAARPGDLARTLFDGGEVDLEALAALENPLQKAAWRARSGARETTAAPRPRLQDTARALRSARSVLARLSVSLSRGARAAGLVPGMLGLHNERRYLLVFQALGEARGTGGVAGLYGLLTANSGRLTLEEVAPFKRLGTFEKVDAPTWFRRQWGPFRALQQWPQANLTPSFEAAAPVFMQMYEQATGEQLDGVLAMDPVLFAELLRATGPIDLRPPLESGTAVEVLLEDSYELFTTPEEQNSYLGRAVAELWGKLSSGRVDSEALLAAFASGGQSGHLQIYSDHAREQADLRAVGVSGAPVTESSLQLVFHNNVAVNKVDYYLRRSIHTDVALSESGGARVTTIIRLVNNAPASGAPLLVGPGIAGDLAGLNRMYLGVLLPKGARPSSFIVEGDTREPFQGTDSAHPLVWDVLEIPAGETRTVAVTYHLPEKEHPGNVWKFTLAPQPRPRPDEYLLTVTAPPGTKLAAPEIAPAPKVELSGELTQPLRLELELVP